MTEEDLTLERRTFFVVPTNAFMKLVVAVQRGRDALLALAMAIAQIPVVEEQTGKAVDQALEGMRGIMASTMILEETLRIIVEEHKRHG